MSPDTVTNLTRRTIQVLGAALLMIVPTVGLSSNLGTDVLVHASRFQVLDEYRGEAVLDTETRLIWERSPSADQTAWANASLRCAFTATGGRLGWRLPSFFELMTLVEPAPRTAASRPTLPAGHPFRSVKADPYWTTTTQPTDPVNAYVVDFLRGDVSSQRKNRAHASWCVRGGTVDAPTTDSTRSPQESI
jgi:hypothetical protein